MELMDRIDTLAEPFQSFIYFGIVIGLCFMIGILANFIFFKFLVAYNRRRKSPTVSFFYQYTAKPMHFFVPLLLTLIFLPVESSRQYYSLVYKIIYVCFSISFAWLLIKLIYVFADSVLARHNVNVENNLTQRKLVTQLQFIKRLLIIIVVIITISAILLNFDSVRKFGAGILTSAGIAGIIIGFAAQRSLGNLLAGLQIAFSQPIRLDDIVVVENEWGRVEEITLTYVVIKIWDMRRLVVPLNYFIEKPFQNWTKTSADIIGSVSWFFDYSVPMEALRNKLDELLKSSVLWDGNVKALQIIGANDKALEIRAIMSSKNAGDSWDLRCFVREEMVKFVRENYPKTLPTFRSEIKMEEALQF